MGSGLGNGFGNSHGNKETIRKQLKSLPKNPDNLSKRGWKETSHPLAKNAGKRDFVDSKTGLKLRFDKGVKGKSGFRGTDHYHLKNPASTGKSDYYLDINGNPVAKGSPASHLIP